MKRVSASTTKLLDRFQSDYRRSPAVISIANHNRPPQKRASDTASWKNLEAMQRACKDLEPAREPLSCSVCGRHNESHPSVSSPSFQTTLFVLVPSGVVCMGCGTLQPNSQPSNKALQANIAFMRQKLSFFQLSSNIMADATCACATVCYSEGEQVPSDSDLMDCLLYGHLRSKVDPPPKPIVIKHFNTMFNTNVSNVVHDLVNASRPGIPDQGALVRSSLETIDASYWEYKCKSGANDVPVEVHYPALCEACHSTEFKALPDGYVCVQCGEVRPDTVAVCDYQRDTLQHGPAGALDSEPCDNSTRYIQGQLRVATDVIATYASKYNLPSFVERDALHFFKVTRDVRPKISPSELAALPLDCLVYAYLVYANTMTDIKQATSPISFVCDCGCGREFNCLRDKSAHLREKQESLRNLQVIVRLPRGDVGNLHKWLLQAGAGVPYYNHIRHFVSNFIDSDSEDACKHWVKTNTLVDQHLCERVVKHYGAYSDSCQRFTWIRFSTLKAMVECDCPDLAPRIRCRCNRIGMLHTVVSKTMSMVASHTSLSDAELVRKYFL